MPARPAKVVGIIIECFQNQTFGALFVKRCHLLSSYGAYQNTLYSIERKKSYDMSGSEIVGLATIRGGRAWIPQPGRGSAAEER